MNILIERKWKKKGYTIGVMTIDGHFFSNTLEDTDRGLTQDMTEDEIKAKKKYGETAIPTGTYNVLWTYSSRFGRYMPLVEGVKGFSGIRIHSGNSAKDTLGCILLGKNDSVGRVSNSKVYCDNLDARIRNCSQGREKVTLTIK